MEICKKHGWIVEEPTNGKDCPSCRVLQIRRYEAFEPGGAVERLLRELKRDDVFDLSLVDDLFKEVEALLPKEEK